MEINVVDVGDSWMNKPLLVLQQQLHKKDVIELLPGPNGIERMVHEVGKRADVGSIDVLRLYAHGNSGIINVGAGKHIDEARGSTLTLDTLKQLKPLLSSLAPYFSSTARVELHGCLVSKGAEGEQLMLELAKVWGVRVQASPETEPIGSVQFQGPLYEANPHRGLSCTIPTPITKG
jgi:hypothetical protein